MRERWLRCNAGFEYYKHRADTGNAKLCFKYHTENENKNLKVNYRAVSIIYSQIP